METNHYSILVKLTSKTKYREKWILQLFVSLSQVDVFLEEYTSGKQSIRYVSRQNRMHFNNLCNRVDGLELDETVPSCLN